MGPYSAHEVAMLARAAGASKEAITKALLAYERKKLEAKLIGFEQELQNRE